MFVRRVVVVVAVLSCVCGWGCWVAFLLVSGSAGFPFGVAVVRGGVCGLDRVVAGWCLRSCCGLSV